MTHPPIVDFPKIKSPFKRITNAQGDYVVTTAIEEGYEWVFENSVRAVRQAPRHQYLCAFQRRKDRRR